MEKCNSSFAINNKNLRNCGSVNVDLYMGQKSYKIHCSYCNTFYLELNTFIIHFENEHQTALFNNVIDINTSNEDKRVFQFGTTRLEDTSLLNRNVDKNPKNDMTANLDMSQALDEEYFELKSNTDSEKIEIDALNESDNFYYESNEETSDTDDHKKEGTLIVGQEGGTNNNIDDILQEENKALVLAIIDAYKNEYPIEQTQDAISTDLIQDLHSYTNIANNVKENTSVDLDKATLQKIIQRFSYEFKLYTETKPEDNEEVVRPWYLKDLEFLGATKVKKRNKFGSKILTRKRSALPIASLTDEQNIQLISIYKRFPCLWNPKDINYRFKKHRQQAITDMQQLINEQMNVAYERTVLEKQIYRIRFACSQEKHRLVDCENKKLSYEPLCKYYQELQFLFEYIGPFQCEICRETFNGPDSYQIHKSQHDGTPPFQCTICKRGFMRAGNLAVHLRRHTGDYPFECELCRKRFATTTDVSVHMRYHTGEKPYFCELCGQSFRTWTIFDLHKRRHLKQATHTCNICNKSFYENTKLKVHMKAHMGVRDKVCDICGKSFTDVKYLTQHKKIHSEKKEYTCKICLKEFAQYAGLSGHMRTHGTTINGMLTDEQH